MSKSEKKKKNDVIIVGTGISGSMVAKLLTDHVYEKNENRIIHRREVGSKSNIREISILMLEAGLKAGLELENTDALNTYSDYIKTYYESVAKVPNSPYPNLKQAPSPDVIHIRKITPPFPDKTGYLVQFGPMPFASDSIRIGGGTTLHWLGTTPRMLPNDFKLKNKYNRAVDWPIDYDELKPYYEMAEFEIGVSGNVHVQQYPEITDMDEYYGKDYVFPMKEIPQSYMDKKIMEKLSGENVKMGSENYPLIFVPSPQARNSTPNPKFKNTKLIKAQKTKKLPNYRLVLDEDKEKYAAIGATWNPYLGERCEGNASCVPICPVQAKYNALKTLKKALYKRNDNDSLTRIDNIEVQAQSVVYKLEVDTSDNERITKLYLRKYFSEDKSDFVEEVIDTSESIVVLAANAFENPKILLNSKYLKIENNKTVERTVANRSDQVGRNLMDHMVLLTWGLFPEPVYPFRGPGSTTNISTFRDGDFRGDYAPWISPLDNWGWGWPAFSPGTDIQEFIRNGQFGTELKESLKHRLTRQFLIHFEIEQLPHPENRVTISEEYLDVMGIPRPIVHFQLTDYEKKGMEQAKLVSDQMMKQMGAKDYTDYREGDNNTFVYNNVRYSYNGAGHVVGTHRMGDDPNKSVTNNYCKAWDHPNLYIVGAGNMPTLGTSNPTLTLTALAIRSVESILSDIEQNIKYNK
ncbi:GMC family oxidoreductase [uncultured Maribacter sp.]|uniref:GMC family oxidoreductase n=1 Tax=uncultured Maribacter sp. TaxID=431308 RepID=UPI0026274B5B|nr:GMC family oxidoreductase [uncultured Maribacter sp.]